RSSRTGRAGRARRVVPRRRRLSPPRRRFGPFGPPRLRRAAASLWKVCGSSGGLLSFQRGEALSDGGALLHPIGLGDAIDRVRVGTGEAHSPGAGHGAIKRRFGRVHLLLGGAVGAGRAVAAVRGLAPRDQVGLQRVFHLALAGAERGKAVLKPLLL